MGLVLLCGGVFAFQHLRGEGAGRTLAVVTYNVGTLNGEKLRVESVVAAIGKEGIPDLVLLQEVPDEAFAAAVARGLGLGFHVFAGYKADGVGYGLAAVSATPLVGKMGTLVKY